MRGRAAELDGAVPGKWNTGEAEHRVVSDRYFTDCSIVVEAGGDVLRSAWAELD